MRQARIVDWSKKPRNLAGTADTRTTTANSKKAQKWKKALSLEQEDIKDNNLIRQMSGFRSVLAAVAADDLPSATGEAALLRQWRRDDKCLGDKPRWKQVHMAIDSTVSELCTLCLTDGKYSINVCYIYSFVQCPFPQSTMSEICSARTVLCLASNVNKTIS